MAEARPSIAAAHAAFGVPARVTIPGGTPVETSVIALPERTIDTSLGGLTATETRRVFGLRREAVPAAPDGTRIEVLEGLDAGTYFVDRTEVRHGDEIRALVVPA